MEIKSQKLKLRRLNDSRVEPNIIAVQIANAGGIQTSKEDTDIIYRQYLKSTNGWIEVRKKTGEFVRINRNLTIFTNVASFDKEKAKEILKQYRYYYYE